MLVKVPFCLPWNACETEILSEGVNVTVLEPPIGALLIVTFIAPTGTVATVCAVEMRGELANNAMSEATRPERNEGFIFIGVGSKS